LIESYGQIHGGQEGKLAAQLFSTVAPELLTVTGALPETILATGYPLIGQAATAYAAWSIVADLSGAWLAADIGKLAPFDWPKGDPMDRIAKASELFDPKEPFVAPPEPGAIPEPPPAPSSWWKSPLIPGGILAVAAGVALSGSSSGSTGGSGGGDNCSTFTTQVNKCGTTSGGIQFTGFLVPTKCGNCPAGSTRSGTDNVSAGGPYYICSCN
jgi:hypothetical protein